MKGRYYQHVPKGIRENLEYRRRVLRWGAKSRENARLLCMISSRDMLFWVNTFAWTFDPRRDPSARPFITYPFQDEAAETIENALGRHDLLLEKSRDMGISWLGVGIILWRWRFRSLQSYLLVSRKEDFVDKTGDPKSLFWKMDFILERMPGWMRPSFSRLKLHLQNNDNGSTIDGESTTGDVARGDRRTAIWLDEFAAVDNGDAVLTATADATDCRLFASTPQGTGNAFYTVRQSDIAKLRLHWSLHPRKSEGLYYDEDGKPRSPWYDRECERRSHPLEVAQELDIDYLASDYQFFDQVSLNLILKEKVRPPYQRGVLEYDYQTARPVGFSEKADGGSLFLWFYPDPATGSPPADRDYVIGADVSMGTGDSKGRGASNSCLSVGDRKTGEKVAALAVSTMAPHDFAKLAVALARWFRGKSGAGAYLVWEGNGPGRLFEKAVLDLGYNNIYYRDRDERDVRGEVGTRPGWWSSPETKLVLIGDYRKALCSDGTFINRDMAAIKECEFYVFTARGVEHRGAGNTLDPSGARANHGDRVIADALCWMGMKTDHGTAVCVQETIPENCLYSRRRRHEERRAERSNWRGNWRAA